MKFLCLGYLNEEAFSAVPEAKRNAIMKECFALCEPFRATGKVVEEEAVGGSSLAKTIRTKNGRVMVTDGPFLETKEQIGSFFVVEAESIEEAIKVASMHPAALMGEEYGFGIELRPIH